MVFPFPQVRRLCGLLIVLASWMAAPGMAQSPPEYVEGEVIVTFKSAVTQRTAESSLQRRSLRFQRRYEELSHLRRKPMGLVRERGKKTQDLITELQNDPSIESVEPNYLRYIKAIPNDSRFSEQWALRNTGQTVDGVTGTSGADVKYLEAMAIARPPTEELVVAVIDTGVDVTHPELAPRMWTNSQEIPDNNIDDDGNGYVDDYYGYDFVEDLSDPSDISDHGTHIAGTIAAQGNNSSGVIGINDHVRIMALKVSANGDTMSTSAVIEAMEYAVSMKRRGVNLVALNASYGGSGYSNAERAAIQTAGVEGIILCAAAGNESVNNNTTPSYPASYGLANIITVASSTQNDTLSSFSNFGSTSVDLAAPGSNILSTAPTAYAFQVGSGTHDALPMAFAGSTSGFTGQIIHCGLGYPSDFPPSVSGKIALIARGTLDFSVKVANAKAAGAIAAVIYNNVAGLYAGTLGSAGPWIPAFSISQAAGQSILASLPASGTLTSAPGYKYLDGTSMATPQVAGAVAFAAQNFPNDTVAQRKERILSNVDVKTSLQGKVRTNGRLNLNRIVDADQDGIPDWQDSILTFTQVPLLPGGVLQVPYSRTFSITSGTAPFVYQVSAGSLPPGFSLSPGGVLSGFPSQAGTFSFTVEVTDDEDRSGERTFTLVIAAQTVLVTSTDPLPEGSEGAPYSTALTASGGTAPYAWTLASGSLPAGLSLSSSGIISGVPTQPGSSQFTLRVVDAHQLVNTRPLSLTITLSPIAIVNEETLPYGMKGEDYSLAFTAEGGTAPYTWALLSGRLPPGTRISPEGILSGKPTTASHYDFRIQVTDAENVITSKSFLLSTRTIYTLPVLDDITLGSTHIGAEYTATLTATHYPRSYKVTGLPKGLKVAAKTGIISGIPKEHGDFTVQVIASNPAGKSQPRSGTLTVRPMPAHWVGSFTGVIARDATANAGLGSRFTLTTTALGSFSIKVTTGKSTKAAKGFLTEGDTQASVSILDQVLNLTLDADTQLISGTHGSAAVTGWRIPWHAKTAPALDQMGYYSAGLNLSEPDDIAQEAIPQGTGYLALRVNTAGIASIAGRSAAGDKVTSSGGIGIGGQTALYQSLYKHQGTLAGSFRIQLPLDETGIPAENRLAGNVSWLKPADASRTYPDGFGPLAINLSGGYLAPKSSGGTVLGLPQPGSPAVKFTDGGLALSDTDPDLAAFELSSAFKAILPASGSLENPARTTLRINKSSGLLNGTFTLTELDSKVKRKVKYLGIVIPQSSGQVKAQGYFLLPQLPTGGLPASKTPILSGGVQILEIPAAD
ncbi:S8 family serine peptidase [Prosthecobacter sp. SYSU 5D2]|uniref:S8 family serine peptidase n=1 Tax=Prosthecobacter sp. SYSU 5D2 TaxID=3134134 RepID=UPI0031FE7DF9